MNASPFLLVGHDFEGDVREIGCCTLQRAQDLAAILMTDANGPAWLDWAIWWNNPDKNGEWEVHSTSP